MNRNDFHFYFLGFGIFRKDGFTLFFTPIKKLFYFSEGSVRIIITPFYCWYNGYGLWVGGVR